MSSTYHLLTIAEILTERYINLIEQQSESEDELFVRLDRNQRAFALHDRQKLDFASLDDDLCKLLFRFTYAEIKRVTKAMRLPKKISFRSDLPDSFKMNRDYALAIMLRRLAYPSRMIDLEQLFGIECATIEIIFYSMIELLYSRFQQGLRLNKEHLHAFNLMCFADASDRRESPFTGVVGYIDGPVGQHGLKSQSIVTPDGITVSLCGPYAGTTYDDQAILESSQILDELRECLDLRNEGDKLYAIYGDPAYRECDILIKPIRISSRMDRIDKQMNETMSSLKRVAEYEFEHVADLFGFLKYKPGHKFWHSRCTKFYPIATLMKNIHICLNDGESSKYFGMIPPTLEEYMDGMHLQHFQDSS